VNRPKVWNGRQAEQKKPTAKKKPPAPTPLTAPVEPIPDEVEVQDEPTTLGDST
jgi:hypothetical protein